MSDKEEDETGIKGILLRQGKIIGHLESLQLTVSNIYNKVDRNNTTMIEGFKEVRFQCAKTASEIVKNHASSCPLIETLNTHIIVHKEKEVTKEKAKSNKEGWFKWITSIIITILGIKWIWDFFITSSHKITQHVDKIIK